MPCLYTALYVKESPLIASPFSKPLPQRSRSRERQHRDAVDSRHRGDAAGGKNRESGPRRGGANSNANANNGGQQLRRRGDSRGFDHRGSDRLGTDRERDEGGLKRRRVISPEEQVRRRPDERNGREDHSWRKDGGERGGKRTVGERILSRGGNGREEARRADGVGGEEEGVDLNGQNGDDKGEPFGDGVRFAVFVDRLRVSFPRFCLANGVWIVLSMPTSINAN